jgi:hypothetical protein
VWHDNYETYQTVRPQKQYTLDGSKFFDLARMNHELKFGFGYRNTPVNSISAWPGPSHGRWSYSGITAGTCTSRGLAVGCGLAVLPRDVAIGYTEKYNNFYVGDTILMGNLTLQGGLRWDHQKTANEAVSVAANPILATPLTLPLCPTVATCNTAGTQNALLPALSYAGDSRPLKWNSISPRIGATYSLGADKRTLLRASYNRYASQLGSAVSGANPLAYSAFYIYGFDTNGDHTIQRNELLKIRSSAGVNAANPTSPALTRRVDYGMKVPTTDEFILGGERELLSDFSAGINYTYRKYNNLVTTRFEKTAGAGDYYTSADYVLAGRTAGGTFIQCTVAIVIVNGQQVCNGNTVTSFPTNTVTSIYQLAPGVPTPVYRVLTNRAGYSQKYSGFEVTATKRLSHKWMFRGNFSYNDYTESCGAGSFANPTPALPGSTVASGGPGRCPGGQVAPQSAGSGAFGNDFVSSKWNFNMTGLYVLPWDFNLGASLAGRQGYPAPLRDTVTGLAGGNVGVVLNPIGDIRFANVYELDLRIAKDFRIMNRVGLTVSGDLFNVPNRRTILQRNTPLLQTTSDPITKLPVESSLLSGYRIQELQSPRVWRLGARFSF